MDVLAQMFGVFGAFFNILGMFFKNKIMILLFVFMACICFSISAFMLGGISGGMVSLVQALLAIVNYFFDKRGVHYPTWLIILYIFICLLIAVFTYRSFIDILPIICFLLFVISILQSKELNLKICMLFMFLFFALYAFFINGFVLVVINLFQAFMTLISIVRLWRLS